MKLLNKINANRERKCNILHPHIKHYVKCSSMIVLCSFLMLNSCDRDEVFEKEQYKNIFALISGSDNVKTAYHSLGEETIGYLAASLGGSNFTTKDIIVNMVEDPALIDNYNKINYDIDKTKYILPMPKSNYDIDNYQFTIPAGETGGKLPIRIRADGLSTDQDYFIPLRIESFSAYEANQDKNYVLYRVRIKNWWANRGGTTYNMNAKMGEVGQLYEIALPGSKRLDPLTKNQVRMMTGNKSYKTSDMINFNNWAIILTINSDKTITISPFKDLQVTQIDGDKLYNNTFVVENTGYQFFKLFRLRYNYVDGATTYEIKEELRLEFVPGKDDPF